MNRNNPEIFLVLNPKLTVSKSFFDTVNRQVKEMIPALFLGHGYTLEDLCGADFWGPLSDGQRRLAGRCMVYMVRNGLLPLEFTGHICASPKRYQLK